MVEYHCGLTGGEHSTGNEDGKGNITLGCILFSGTAKICPRTQSSFASVESVPLLGEEEVLDDSDEIVEDVVEEKGFGRGRLEKF